MTSIRLNIEQGNALNREGGNLQMSFCKVPPDARHWVPARQELWLGWEEGSRLRALILPHRRTYTFWSNTTFIRSLTFGFSLELQRVWTAQKNNKEDRISSFFGPSENFSRWTFWPMHKCALIHADASGGSEVFVFILSLLFMNMLLNKLTGNKCLSVAAEYNVPMLIEYVRPQKPVWKWGDEENHIHMSQLRQVQRQAGDSVWLTEYLYINMNLMVPLTCPTGQTRSGTHLWRQT